LYISYTSFHSAADMKNDRKAFNFPEKFKGYQDVFSINWTNGEPYFFINGYISVPMNNPSEKVVGTIGTMLSPKNNDALVLGLGSGGTASVVGMLFDHTDVVEINPVVVENQYRMKRWNFDIIHNPKVSIVIDDAIHYTKASNKQYDMILNTVTSPLYFSSSKLYTLDFFNVVKKRLRPDGVYVTWMDGRIGSEGAKIILKTLQQRFKYCTIAFIKSGYFLLTAADQPVHLRHPDAGERVPELKHYLMKNEIIPRSIAYNLLSEDVFDFGKGAKISVNTIDNPVLEFEMASVKKRDFGEFRKPLVDSVTLDKVEKLIEPAMKYDPVEHVVHIRTTLESSPITDQMVQQGNLYINSFILRADEREIRTYETLAEQVQDANAYQRLGDQYRLRMRYAEAIAQYSKVIALAPNHLNTEYNFAACLEHLGDFGQALVHYRLAGKATPKDPDVPYRLARTYLKMGNLPEAEKYVEHALAMERTENSLVLKANLMGQLGRTDAMIATYFEVLKLNPKNTEVETTLGDLLRKW
jgi:tetratricopeptide (TPR) repeat protein